MSVTFDTNVLVYASNTDAVEHIACRTLLSRLIAGPGLVTLFWPVLLSYLRIVTHHSIFARPLDPAQAEAAVDAILRSTSVRVVGQGDSFWAAYRQVRSGTRPRGNLVPDAAIVAMMAAHGVRRIYSRDRYFRQFDGIEVIDPMTG